MEEVSLLMLVLHHWPKASRVMDGCDQLPLHIAIDCAKRVMQNLLICHKQKLYTNLNGIYSDIDIILQANPDALEQKDGVTKLFPFMQAAEGEDADLELTYHLLRQNPILVQAAFEQAFG